MTQTKKLSRKVISYVLALVMVFSTMTGIVPGMSLTAQAEDPYASLKNTTTVIKFDDKDWYLIDYDDSTVTLLSKDCVGTSTGYNAQGAANTYYTNKISDTVKTAIVDNKMFILTKAQADNMTAATRKCNVNSAQEVRWWLDSYRFGNVKYCVDSSNGSVDSDVDWPTYGFRPALKLDLSRVAFFSSTNTFKVHSHNFTYSASGANITAKCKGTDDNGVPCHLENLTATLTISAPEEGFDAKITDKDKIQGSATVSYYNVDANDNKTGEALASAPTEIGRYWAEITLGEGENVATAHVVYGVEPVASIGDTLYTALQDAINAANDNDSIKLLSDVKERVTIEKSDVTATLDLNGYKIDGNQKGTVVTIKNGTLILDDSSEGKTGVITNGTQGVAVNGGTFKMNNGTIEGNKGTTNGAGVSVANGATFEMIGGAVQYNETTSYTGGVLLGANNVNFTMNGGSIQYNTGSTYGGLGIAGAQPKFSGTAVVKGNVMGGAITKTETGYTLTGGTPCDVRNTTATAKIEIAGKLEDGAQIGVYNYTNGNAITTGYNTYNATDDADKFFFSNDVTKLIAKNEGGELIFSNDTHDFEYTADGSTITATCKADNCGLKDNKIELTIAKPAHTEVSDGKSASAILDNLALFKSATGQDIPSIEYYNANDTKLDAAPTGLGTYTAKITVAEKTASVDYTIIQNCGDGVTCSYNSATKTLTISKTGEGTGVMSDYDNPEDAPWNVYKDEAEKIVIEDGVTGIGKNAFTTLTKATSATIAKSVTAIGENAFAGCTALTTVTFEPAEKDNTIQIGNGAFPEAAKPAYGEGNTKLYDNDTLVNTTTALNTVNGKTLTWKNPIDTTEFDAAITEANALLEKLKENAYADIKTALEAAKATANTGINNSNTQTEADAVVTALKAAITKAQGDKTDLDDKAVKDAVDKINEIGTVEYTETCKAKIDAARAAYELLSPKQKTIIEADENKPLETLEAAEAAYETLKADNEAAQAVIAKINAIGTVEYTDACKEKIDAARAAYELLSPKQKTIIEADENKPLETLEAAEAAYAALKANNEAAKEVIDKINAIGTVEYTDECKGKIEAARAAYEILTPAQGELVTNYETLTAAEKQYKDLADKAAAQKVIDAINALPADNITTSDKEAIEAARKAYNEL